MKCFRCDKEASSLCSNCCKPMCVEHTNDVMFKDSIDKVCFGKREVGDLALEEMLKEISNGVREDNENSIC